MPLTLAVPPQLEDDFWEQPDIVAAVEAGDVGQLLLAFRGARRARWPQDKVARMIGYSQAMVSEIESGRRSVSDQRLDSIFRGLGLPPDLRRRWGR